MSLKEENLLKRKVTAIKDDHRVELDGKPASTSAISRHHMTV